MRPSLDTIRRAGDLVRHVDTPQPPASYGARVWHYAHGLDPEPCIQAGLCRHRDQPKEAA